MKKKKDESPTKVELQTTVITYEEGFVVGVVLVAGVVGWRGVVALAVVAAVGGVDPSRGVSAEGVRCHEASYNTIRYSIRRVP